MLAVMAGFVSLDFFIAVVLGVAAHLVLFIRGEWHLQAPWILVSHLACFSFTFILLPHTASQAITGYVVGLFSSIITYRLFFHQLRCFPGPVGAGTTKLWHLWTLLSSSKPNHIFLQELHRRYGDFIRTGPSEIAVFHPDIFMAVDGPTSQCIKAEWYDMLHPHSALVTARTRELHGPRRRWWTRAFNRHAQFEYQDQILPLIGQLDACIQRDIAADRVSDVTGLCKHLWFDRMGALVLGKTFDMLSSPSHRFLIARVQRALTAVGTLGLAPWLIHVAIRLLPRVWILGDYFDMIAWADREMRERLLQLVSPSQKPSTHDLASYLFAPEDQDLRAAEDKHDKDNLHHESWITGDSILAIVAGFEPTSTAMVNVLYELARRPSHAEKVHDEISRVPDSSMHDGQALSRACPHLAACIFEALRLYPPLPFIGIRKTLHEGITVAGTYIPPETTIVVPKQSIACREDCFPDATSFVPERWTTRPDMVSNRAAFAPFGTGPRSCLGRTLAMNDMMLVGAHLVRNYHLRFAKGDPGDQVQSNWKDKFTSNLGRLQLVFEPRGVPAGFSR
ncbi:hypothetical protein BDW71DRAFT_213961 [Aspergillus fruticulosus]